MFGVSLDEFTHRNVVLDSPPDITNQNLTVSQEFSNIKIEEESIAK